MKDEIQFNRRTHNLIERGIEQISRLADELAEFNEESTSSFECDPERAALIADIREQLDDPDDTTELDEVGEARADVIAALALEGFIPESKLPLLQNVYSTQVVAAATEMMDGDYYEEE